MFCVQNDLFENSVEPEFYENTTVFINLKNETNFQKLKELEAGFTAVHEYLLIEDSSLLPCEFNLKKLKSIHRHFFNDLYSWAGKTRSYDMRRNGDAVQSWENMETSKRVHEGNYEPITNLILRILYQERPLHKDDIMVHS